MYRSLRISLDQMDLPLSLITVKPEELYSRNCYHGNSQVYEVKKDFVVMETIKGGCTFHATDYIEPGGRMLCFVSSWMCYNIKSFVDSSPVYYMQQGFVI